MLVGPLTNDPEPAGVRVSTVYVKGVVPTAGGDQDTTAVVVVILVTVTAVGAPGAIVVVVAWMIADVLLAVRLDTTTWNE
jgi:hypothetical protein